MSLYIMDQGLAAEMGCSQVFYPSDLQRQEQGISQTESTEKGKMLNT